MSGTNGGSRGIVGQAIELSKSMVSTLPPAFLLLILINFGFLGMTMWFLDSQMESRLALATKIIEDCMKR